MKVVIKFQWMMFRRHLMLLFHKSDMFYYLTFIESDIVYILWQDLELNGSSLFYDFYADLLNQTSEILISTICA